MPATAGLDVRAARIPFGSRAGLEALSLSVPAGARVALLGPSGAGKTTLLRAIAGLDAMTAGTVHVGGRDVTHALPEQRGVVYLQQTPMLFPHLSVIDNVGFPLEVRGVSRAAARVKAGELLERVHLSNLSHRAAHALSGGQRHRVALARALAADPAVLLLDEPFNALDPTLRGDVRDAVFTMLARDRGPSVVVVTHDVDEAAALAGRVAILVDGVIAQDAPPALLLARPATLAVARFLGIPNIVRGSAVDGIFRCALGAFPSTGTTGPCALVARLDAFVVSSVDSLIEESAQSQSQSQSRLVRVRVIEIRERVSGTLALVRVTDDAGQEPPVDIVAQRGDERVCAGVEAVLTIAPDRVHVVQGDEPRGVHGV